MGDMSSVYIVTSGEYSDYGISSVWSTREAAEKAKSGFGQVEEWLLDTDGENDIVQWHAWVVPATGEIRVGDRAETTNNPQQTEAKAPGGYSGSRYAFWTGHGYGPSPEHARKSLSDAIAKAKAEANEATDG